MRLPFDFSPAFRLQLAPRLLRLPPLLLLISLLALLSGCAKLGRVSQGSPSGTATAASVPEAHSNAAKAGTPSASATQLGAGAAPSANTNVAANTAAPQQPDAAALALAHYSERVRSLSAPELNAELARLANSAAPQEQLQLALALAQLHQLPELIRAQEAVTRVLSNASGDAKALHPLARLLAVRLGEQRRFEDLLDKQNQQLKDLQRRLDQTTERLEALKAIERSLVSRPTPAPPQAVAPAASSANRGRGAPALLPAPARSATPQP